MVSKFTPSSLKLGNYPRFCQVHYADCIDYACIVRFTDYAIDRDGIEVEHAVEVPGSAVEFVQRCAWHRPPA